MTAATTARSFDSTAVFLVWGPPSHGNRARVFARGLGIDVHHVYSTTRRGAAAAPMKYAYQLVATLLFLARHRPEVVFVQNPPSLAVVVVGFYAAVMRKRFVVDAHTDAFVSPYWTRPQQLYRVLARRAVTTVVTNDHFAETVRRWGGDAVVIRDIPASQPEGSYPLPAGFNVVVVATFAYDEPLEEIFRAAKKMSDVRFHVTGDPKREGASIPRPIPDNVELTGFLPLERYSGLLRDSDVVMCLTTRDHTMQRGACEALSLGKPVITSDWPVLREYFSKGTIHVDNSADAIAAAVERMRTDLDHYRERIAELQTEVRLEWERSRELLLGRLSAADSWDIRTSEALPDDRWDSFIRERAGGHHLQTSRWAQVKGAGGWRAVRVTAETDDEIVGGAQILYRAFGMLGNVGYMPMGPVTALDDLTLASRLKRSVEQIARDRMLRMLVVQEPVRGPHPSSLQRGVPIDVVGQVAPRATVLIDVTRPPDEMRAQMKARTRYNTKVGPRNGIDIRTGSAADLPTFHAILMRTAERQGFEPCPLSHFEEMWRAFDAMRSIRLTFAELEGRPVAAQIAITFGDTVVNKMSVWSGEHGSRRPNDALQWDTIAWAHRAGFRYYDLEGIRIEAAEAVIRGEDPPEQFMDSVTSFKLGYGGHVVVRPQPYALIPNPMLRIAFRLLYPRLARRRSMKRTLKRLGVASSARAVRVDEGSGPRR